jgi:hypothetical protein
MLSFKKWLKSENLVGPGGGPEFNPDSQESLAFNISKNGSGAFPTFGDEPPNNNYLDLNKKFQRKYMSKNNKKNLKNSKK